jgi:HSP20 family protein
MTLIRWNPAHDLPAFPGGILSTQREINRMFDSFFREGAREDDGLASCAWTPAVDLVDQDNAFVVKMEVPGVERGDVKITVENGMLTVRGEKKQQKESKEKRFHRTERTFGSFQRSFSLPGSVNTDRVEAALQDGILTVTLPKAEGARTREIDVKVK